MQLNWCLLLVVLAVSIFLVNIEKVLAKSVRTMVNNEPPNCVLVETLLLAQHNFSVSYQQTGFANKEEKEKLIKEESRDSSVGDNKNKTICDGKCCDKNAESQLKLHVQREFSTLVSDNLMSLNSLLGSISENFQNHVIDLTARAENKTAVLMKKIYHRMAVLAERPIKMLFADIRRYTQVHELDNDISSGKLDIKSTIMSFFSSIFPLVYHHAAHPNSPKDFSPSYKNCLKSSFEAIQAFGNIPQEVSNMLQKSLESTRLLLQAFQAGKDVLNTTNDILINNPQPTCIYSLMKMINCPKCLGYNQEVKPCPGFCLNVFRGCLNTLISDLDSPWKSYVEAIEKMIYISRNDNNELGINIDIAIRNLNLKISESIMESIENAASLKSYTELQCGPVEFAKSEELDHVEIKESSNEINLIVRALPDQNSTSGESAENERWRMLGQIVRKADFFGTLADNLCKDSTFAESKDQDCWNGQNIGQYAKTIIEAKYSMQKYNPEIKLNESPNSYPTSLLADKLRHVHHIIMAQINTDNYVDGDNHMQGDAADGSGSGDESDYETDISGSGETDSAESFTKSYGGLDTDADATTTSTPKTATEQSPLPPPPKKGFAIRLENSKLFTISVTLGVLFLKAQFLLNC